MVGRSVLARKQVYLVLLTFIILEMRAVHTKRVSDDSSRGKEHHNGKKFKNIWGEDMESMNRLQLGAKVYCRESYEPYEEVCNKFLPAV